MNESTGTTWGEHEAQKYEMAKHGPDGALFIDPHLRGIFSKSEVTGKRGIDIGGGSAPWSEYLLSQGAKEMVALDVNFDMLRQGMQRLPKPRPEGTGKLWFMHGSAEKLDVEDNSFDFAVSINVGCNLPLHAVKETGTSVFEQHFVEAYRALKSGGKFTVTAPDSLDVIFTDGSPRPPLQERIDELWKMVTDHTVSSAKKLLATLTDIHRATFILDESGKPVVITNGNLSPVSAGRPIIRKIPGLVIDNIYHTREEYIRAAEKAGFTILKKHSSKFQDEQSREEYNTNAEAGKTLGSAYSTHPPFLVLELQKPEA